MDLLLFHEARRAGKKLTIFDDAVGDYMGTTLSIPWRAPMGGEPTDWASR